MYTTLNIGIKHLGSQISLKLESLILKHQELFPI